MIYKILVLFFVVKNISSALLEDDDENVKSYTNLAKFAAQMFLTECPNCKTTLVITTENDLMAHSFFTAISQKQNNMGIFTIGMENFTTYQNGEYPGYHPDLTILFLNEDSYASSDAVIFDIELLPIWYIRGKFLIVAAGVPADDNEWIQDTFKAFWERQVLRVLICFWRDGLQLYAYNPFLDNFGYDVTNRSDLSEIFAHKIRNMYGYPIKTYHFDAVLKDRVRLIEENGKKTYIGFDGMYLGTVISVLNASLIIHGVTEDFGVDLIQNADLNTPFSEFTDLFADMYDYDMLLNAARAYIDNDMDKMTLYERDDMVILVPRAQRIPQYLLLFQIVPYNVWFASLSSLFVVSLTMIFIRKSSSRQIFPGNTFMDNFRFLLNESPPSRDMMQQERFVFLLWALHCIVFSTLFQSIFMSTLVVPRYYPEVDTFEDLYKTDIKVYSGEYRRIQIIRGNNGSNKQLEKHMLAVPKELTVYAESLDWIANYRPKHGFIIAQQQVYELEHRDNEAVNAYHIMRENPMPTAFTYCIRKSKLFYEEIHYILLRIQDTGLNIHWIRFDYFMKYSRLDQNETRHSQGDGTQALTIDHFQSAFMLLGFCYGLAFAAFCVELIVSRISERCDNTKVYTYTP